MAELVAQSLASLGQQLGNGLSLLAQATAASNQNQFQHPYPAAANQYAPQPSQYAQTNPQSFLAMFNTPVEPNQDKQSDKHQ